MIVDGGVGWFVRLGLGWGVGVIVVFPLDSVWVSWGEFVGAWGIDALWDLIVNESLVDAFMSVSGE